MANKAPKKVVLDVTEEAFNQMDVEAQEKMLAEKGIESDQEYGFAEPTDEADPIQPDEEETPEKVEKPKKGAAKDPAANSSNRPTKPSDASPRAHHDNSPTTQDTGRDPQENIEDAKQDALANHATEQATMEAGRE